MTIASEITRLQGAKDCIKASIEAKGVTVPSNLKLQGYSACIDSIQTGGGGPSWVAIPVPGLQSSAVENCYFTNGRIGYACCCGFEYFLGCTYYNSWCCGKIINTGCTVIVPTSNYRNFNGVSDDGIWCKQSNTYYVGYTRNGTRCTCYSTPQGYTNITLDYNAYRRVGTRPARGCQSYDYIDIVFGCKRQ